MTDDALSVVADSMRVDNFVATSGRRHWIRAGGVTRRSSAARRVAIPAPGSGLVRRETRRVAVGSDDRAGNVERVDATVWCSAAMQTRRTAIGIYLPCLVSRFGRYAMIGAVG